MQARFEKIHSRLSQIVQSFGGKAKIAKKLFEFRRNFAFRLFRHKERAEVEENFYRQSKKKQAGWEIHQKHYEPSLFFFSIFSATAAALFAGSCLVSRLRLYGDASNLNEIVRVLLQKKRRKNESFGGRYFNCASKLALLYFFRCPFSPSPCFGLHAKNARKPKTAGTPFRTAKKNFFKEQLFIVVFFR